MILTIDFLTFSSNIRREPMYRLPQFLGNKVCWTVVFFLCASAVEAQWTIQQVPTRNILGDIYFADSSNGWAAGEDGIFHSSDGGANWELQIGTLSALLTGLSASECWAAGLRDTLLHTTDRGIHWLKQSTAMYLDLDSIQGTSKNHVVSC